MIHARFYFFSVVFAILFQVEITAQETDTTRWTLTVAAGMEEHDKRLGTFPRRDVLLNSQPEFFGTYSVTTGIQRQAYSDKRFSIFYGLNHVYNFATFLRPYNDYTRPDGTATTFDIKYVDRYRELMLAPLIGVNVSAVSRVRVGVLIQSKFRYHLKASNKTVIQTPFTGPWSFQFRAIEAYLSTSYFIGNKMDVSMRYRISQLLRNDRNLLNILTHPPVNAISPVADFEFFNPVKLELAFSYSW